MSSNTIILKSYEDWPRWHLYFESTAKILGVWHYVNPKSAKKKTLTEPPLFCYEDEVKNIKDEALDVPLFQMLEVRRLEYQIRRDDYIAEKNAYNDLRNWVWETVDKSLHSSLWQMDDLRDVVVALRNNVGFSEVNYIMLIQQRYVKVLRQANPRMPVTDWIAKWFDVYAEAKRLAISEVSGRYGLNTFLDAAMVYLPQWAETQQWELYEEKEGTLPMTLDSIACRFQMKINAMEISQGSNSSSTADTKKRDTEGYECACGIARHKHSWKATECLAWQLAVNGVANPPREIKQSRVDRCKRAMDDPRWKQVVNTLRKKKPKGPENDNAENPPVPIVNIVTDNGQDESATPEAHPLFNLTVFSTCSNTHLVNKLELLEDVTEVDPAEMILVGTESVRVTHRGKRIIKNRCHGPNGKNTCNIELRNVAFVPGFHTNLLSATRFRQSGYWFSTWDNTLRHGTMANNEVMMDMKSMHGAIVM